MVRDNPRQRSKEYMASRRMLKKSTNGIKALAVMGRLRYSNFMRTPTDTVGKTIPSTEIKRRGLSVIDKALKNGPVHVLKNNEPAYVIMAEDQYRELAKRYRKSYLGRIRRSLKDLKHGSVQHHTAQSLIDELQLES